MHTNINNVKKKVPHVACAKKAQIQVAKWQLVDSVFKDVTMSSSI